MSKLILGQTGTTDEKSFVGSAQIHNDILTTYITAIKSKIENHVNRYVIPLMYRHGMITAPGLRFKWDNDEAVDLAKKFEFTKELLKSYTIPAEWINETFNIPVEDMALTESNSVIPGVKNLYDGIK
jgi:phage gp29-like protein